VQWEPLRKQDHPGEPYNKQVIMSIDLTGWKVKEENEGSTMCASPELKCPVYNIAEFFFGEHWAMWTSGKFSVPFQDQIDFIVNVMEKTYDGPRPGFAFDKKVVEQFKLDAAEFKEKHGENIVTTWM